MKRLPKRVALLAICFLLVGRAAFAETQTLDDALRQQPASELVRLAKAEGDATRGAVVFFQHYMNCSKCHAVGEPSASALGPDLTKLSADVSDEMLVESVLLPSKVIRKGYEAVTIQTVDGTTLTGVLVEQAADKVTLRDASRGGKLTTLKMTDVEELKRPPLSIMPAGQVNQLAGRQQFYDLIRYLLEIRAGGAARARELQPSPALTGFVLPEYEQHLDHRGLIGAWNADSLKRGEAIYRRVCANCHGTKDQLGSLPTSLRFAEGKFKNGSDPLTIYQTLTRGFGLMAPQTWMVPSQKYDVIHYLRETYLKLHNSSQYVSIDEAYLARLPAGNTRGPEPSKIEPWSAMDYGPNLTHSYEVPGPVPNLAYKGIAVRLDPGAGGISRGRHWMLYDADTLRVAAAWSGAGAGDNFIDWRGIQLNGEHNIHPRLVGSIAAANSFGPGWGDANGSFRDDRRVEGRDGRRYGPLPRDWTKFRGLYHHGQQVVLSYSVGSSGVLELPRVLSGDKSPRRQTFLRTLNIGPRDRDLVLQIAEHPTADAQPSEIPETQRSVVLFAPRQSEQNKSTPTQQLWAGFSPTSTAATWIAEEGRLRLRIPAGKEPLRFTVWTTAAAKENLPAIAKSQPSEWLDVVSDPDLDLQSLTQGGPPRWPQKLDTQPVIGTDEGPFAVDVLTAPTANPWLAQMRFTGLDFFPDGRIAVCTWDGDVWSVDFQAEKGTLAWRRIASGLYQPLGLKIVDGKIHVICRDQLAVLHDLNGDGETDFYECLNNDHQVTEHFHEFAMGLQTDAAGNFYYAKSGRHALPAVVPHHGTLLRVSRDGSHTEILANGFRAANGVCLNPDGSFVVTDQEGFWNPKNRINWVTLAPSGKPKFYGNLFGYTDVTDPSDAAMEPPLCWITNKFDRSPAELLWVDSNRWGPLKGSLLNLSYGNGKVFLVPHERVNGTMQGGMIALPMPPFPTGVMRGRFHPAEGQLYLCGMFAWAGSATQPGGLYRLRATGRPIHLPVGLQATKSGIKLTFTEPLDPATIAAGKVQIQTWLLKRTAQYGSKHYDEKRLVVRNATLSPDRKTVLLDVPDLRPTWCMEIKYEFGAADGGQVSGVIHNTIHELAD